MNLVASSIKRRCTAEQPLRVAVLASGAGSNLKSLLRHTHQYPDSYFRIQLVISNVPQAGALSTAEEAGVPHLAIPHAQFSSRADFEQVLIDSLCEYTIELVVLAGFMRIVSPVFIDQFYPRIINIHPALCPQFPGAHAVKDALEAGVKETGCTLHVVDKGVDTGPILLQKKVPILPGDDVGSLHQRIRLEEHRLLPELVEQIAREAGGV